MNYGFERYARFIVVALIMVAIVVRDTIHIQDKMHAIHIIQVWMYAIIIVFLLLYLIFLACPNGCQSPP